MSMAKNTNKSKNGKAALVGQLLAGLKKHFTTATQSITVGGVGMTVADATNQLEALVANRSAVVAAQATAKAKLDTENAQLPAQHAFVDAFIAFVRVTYGTQADLLVDFGVAPPKARTPLTTEQKAVAAAKRTATRAARGTQGPKAKEAVHGNVTAQVVVTPVTPPAAAALAAPAPLPRRRVGKRHVAAKVEAALPPRGPFLVRGEEELNAKGRQAAKAPEEFEGPTKTSWRLGVLWRLWHPLRHFFSKRKTSLSFSSAFSTSRTTCPPCSSAPKRSSSPSGRFTSSWITRASGRAPLSGS